MRILSQINNTFIEQSCLGKLILLFTFSFVVCFLCGLPALMLAEILDTQEEQTISMVKSLPTLTPTPNVTPLSSDMSLTPSPRPTNTSSATSTATPLPNFTSTPIPVSTPTVTPEFALDHTINYSFIDEWKPNDNPNGFGADILLKDDLGKDELINFVQYLGSNKDPVLIRIWTSQTAYDQDEKAEYGNEFREGYVLFYVKNMTGEGLYWGKNEIRWMQEIGEFSDLFGQVTKF